MKTQLAQASAVAAPRSCNHQYRQAYKATTKKRAQQSSCGASPLAPPPATTSTEMIKTKHKQAFLRSKASPKQTYYTDVRKHEARLMLLDNKIHSVQNLERHSRTRTDRKATKPSVHHRPREKCPSGPHTVGYLYQTACMHASMHSCTHAEYNFAPLVGQEFDGQLEPRQETFALSTATSSFLK